MVVNFWQEDPFFRFVFSVELNVEFVSMVTKCANFGEVTRKSEHFAKEKHFYSFFLQKNIKFEFELATIAKCLCTCKPGLYLIKHLGA